MQMQMRVGTGLLCTKGIGRGQRPDVYLQALLRMGNPVAVMLVVITIVIILHICEANAVVPKGELEQLPMALGGGYCPSLWHKRNAAGMTNWSQELLALACWCWHMYSQETL